MTYNVKVSTLVRCTFGPLKAALEVEGRIIYQIYLNVRCLVVLAICNAKPCITSIPTTVASDSKAYIPVISLFTRRKRASIIQVEAGG